MARNRGKSIERERERESNTTLPWPPYLTAATLLPYPRYDVELSHLTCQCLLTSLISFFSDTVRIMLLSVPPLLCRFFYVPGEDRCPLLSLHSVPLRFSQVFFRPNFDQSHFV